MAGNVMEVNDDIFEQEVLRSDIPVMVDFWAPWCGPCKAIGPVVEELQAAWQGKMKIVKCNVDNNPVTPSSFGIRAIPTLIFFKSGSVVNQVTGMVQKSKLEDMIKQVLEEK